MDLRLAIAALAGLSLSCASSVHTAAGKPPTMPSPVGVNAFDRQIRNALDAGDGDYALNALRQRVAAEPENVTVRLDLAKAYRDRGYPDVALEIDRLAAARFPESADAELSLVRDLHALKQRSEAIASLEGFLKAHPQAAPEFESWLGILLDESGQWPSGEEHHRAALQMAPARDTLHNNLGYNLFMQKKNAEAAAEFREALKLNPASQIARNNLGSALAVGDTAQAVASFQAASDPATAHNNLAAVLIENGNFPEARRELQLALGYNRTHPAALKNLELVSRLDGRDAALPAAPRETRWQRIKSGFVRLFYGPLDRPKTVAAQAAPAH
ncbi:MAG TPA: tetratricopeptide repeat protein [Bryobacteraceae bacterium]|nr:tetratricopeptide repeat protein [Bryobacteraceae bacterium]